MRKKPTAQASAAERPPRPTPPLPSWYEAGIDRTGRHGGPTPTATMAYVYQYAEGLVAGRYALPEFQRAPVWTTAQRAAFLDTLVRRIPSGVVLLWKPPFGESVPSRPFPGAPAIEHPWLVIDGQQRLTTILMAARGELDLRWNGYEWTTGKGILSAQLAVAGSLDFDFGSALLGRGLDDEFYSAARSFERVSQYVIHACTMEHFTEDEARAVYARMAACGTPHETADLAEVVDLTSIPTFDLTPPGERR